MSNLSSTSTAKSTVSDSIRRCLLFVQSSHPSITAHSQSNARPDLSSRIQELLDRLKELDLQCVDFEVAYGRNFPAGSIYVFDAILVGIEETAGQLVPPNVSELSGGRCDFERLKVNVDLRLEAVETLIQYLRSCARSKASFVRHPHIDDEKAARREELERRLKVLLLKNHIGVDGLELFETLWPPQDAFPLPYRPKVWSFAGDSVLPLKIRLDYVFLRLSQWRKAKRESSAIALKPKTATILLTQLLHCGLILCDFRIDHGQEFCKASWEGIVDVLIESVLDAISFLERQHPETKADPNACSHTEFNIGDVVDRVVSNALPQSALLEPVHPITLPKLDHSEPGSSIQSGILSLNIGDSENSAEGSSQTTASPTHEYSTSKLQTAHMVQSKAIESHPKFESLIKVSREENQIDIQIDQVKQQLASIENLNSSAEVIPYYTFHSAPTVLWFRQSSKKPVFYYFAEEKNLAGLIEFQGFFMRSSLSGYYQRIGYIRFEGKERRESKSYNSPTAQIWQSLQQSHGSNANSPLQPSRTLDSSFTQSSRQSRTVPAIGGPFESSRLYFFADRDIWIMPVGSNSIIDFKMSGNVQIRPVNGRSYLKIHAIHGNMDHPAGLPISSPQKYTQRSKEFRSIDLHFATETACRDFVEGYKSSQAREGEARALMDIVRRTQNTPIIETRSSFSIR